MRHGAVRRIAGTAGVALAAAALYGAPPAEAVGPLVMTATDYSTFDAKTGPPGGTPPGRAPQRVVAGDLNKDGIPDLVTANFLGDAVSVLLGHGDGTFASAVTYSALEDPTVPLGTGQRGNGTQSLVIADFDGDGNPDVLTSNQNAGDLAFMRGLGNGTLATPTWITLPSAPADIEVGDFDEDGKPDLAVATFTTSPSLLVLRNTGPGTFTSTGYNDSFGSTGDVTIGDVDSDGHLDLLNTGLSGDVVVRLGDGDGGFGPTAAPAITVPVSGGVGRIALGDVNEDGKLDLVTGTGTVTVMLGAGDGTFAAGSSYASDASDPNFVASLGLADFTGDDRLDLVVWVRADGKMRIRPGAGDGTFGSAVPIDVPASTGSAGGNAQARFAIADLNDDGQPDLATTYFEPGAVTVLLNGTDLAPPAVTGLNLSPAATTAGSAVRVTANVTDLGTGASTVSAASYRVDTGPQFLMSATDGSLDEAAEDVIGIIDTTGLAVGSHSVCVTATDAHDNVLATPVCTALTITPGGASTGPGGGTDGGTAPSYSCDGLPATIVGTDGPDRIVGTSRRDVIVARGGNDRIDGRGADDVICAGDGDDLVKGGGGDDSIFGQNGNDRLRGDKGRDKLHGGAGRDILVGGPGDDLLDGGKGRDDLRGGPGTNRLKP